MHFQKDILKMTVPAAILLLGLQACGTARLSKFPQYASRYAPPDMTGATGTTTAASEDRETAGTPPAEAPTAPLAAAEPALIAPPAAVVPTVTPEVTPLPVTEEAVGTGAAAGEMSVATPKNASPAAAALKGRRLQRMERLIERVQKKAAADGKEFDPMHNTPFELFLMIMAVAGLVIGLFGVGLGWFVFLVFGGVWLYKKLV